MYGKIYCIKGNCIVPLTMFTQSQFCTKSSHIVLICLLRLTRKPTQSRIESIEHEPFVNIKLFWYIYV